MTPFAALVSLAGLSLREAGDFHGTPIDTIKGWSNGRRRCPNGVITELRNLIEKQETAAGAALEQLLGASATHGPPEVIEIGYPTDDYEARTLGWPCVGAWKAMAARVIVASPVSVALVPRGSTLATAAAIDAKDRRRSEPA